MKALKFSSQISEKIRRQMKEAIAKSAGHNKECGFSFCDDDLSPIVCGTFSHVNLPSCERGKQKGAFHVHLINDGISGVDIVSAIATDNDIDCIGYKDGSIRCYDINQMKANDKTLSEKIKAEYKAVVENTDNDEEAGRQISAIASEAKLQFKPLPSIKL